MQYECDDAPPVLLNAMRGQADNFFVNVITGEKVRVLV